MILEADFHFSWIQPYHNDNIQNSGYLHMTLTFDLYLTLTLSLTFDLDDLKKLTFFLKSRDVKTWRRTSKRMGAYRSAIL